MMTTQPKTYKAVFFGTPEFAVPILETLDHMPQVDLVAVFTQPDKPVGRTQSLTPPAVKIAAQTLYIPVHQPVTLKRPETQTLIQSLQPHVIIVVAYGKIIPQTLLDIPPHGWVNVHASLLPRYRGASPIQAAILHGDTETGITLMQLDAGLDTGPIIAQQSINITPDETSSALHDKLSHLGSVLIEKELPAFLEGTCKPKPQDNEKASTTGIINKKDGKIDWTQPADVIKRQIRAYSPWPGAFTTWDDNRLIIHRVSDTDENSTLQPGMLQRNGDTLLVGTGTTPLMILTAQLAGKNKQGAAALLRGYPQLNGAELN